ncbi:MAG: TraR/DksA C4-type zinc finger protein [Pseudomonadota bacterium]
MQERLQDLLKALDEEEALGGDDRAVVTLDQQSVGRLSRMDAMQRQAMAEAQARRRDAQRLRIKAAVLRLDDGEFGYCTDCGEDIEAKRLDIDPTVPRCLSCATG